MFQMEMITCSIVPKQQSLHQLHHFSGSCEYPDSDFQAEYAFQEAHFEALSLLDIFFSDPEGAKQQAQIGREEQKASVEDHTLKKKSERRVVVSGESISHYFYLPIAEAAKELKVGVTALKKRCRELGIKRWPRRKLISLQTLINNVQEMEKNEGGEKMMKEDIEILKQQKKLIEERPNMELGDRTKRLRQACFKANYKKRKLMEQDDQEFMSFLSHSTFSSDSN